MVFFLGIFFINPVLSQDFELKSKSMSGFIDSLFAQGIKDKLVPGGVIGIIHNDSVVHRGFYGLSNVAVNTPVNFENTRFQLGSVGKLFTAIAVLKEVEKGRLDLNRDVNDYLTEFKISTPNERPVTLNDLLLHTAGFNERLIGYATRDVETVEILGEHLKKSMPSTYTEPGKEISYSNYGFGLAGHLVELSSGLKFQDYVQSEILDMLGMTSATYHVPAEDEQDFAMGYQVREDFNFVKPLPRHVTPAGSISATGSDLSKFTQALLKEDARLLSSTSYELLKIEQFTPHPLLTGHAYGIEVQNFNGHVGVGKGGNIPGFLSFVVLFPQYNFGMFVAVNTETDNFLEDFVQPFKDEFFPRQTDGFQPVVSKTDLSEFSGDFRANRYNRNTIEDMFALFQGNATIHNVRDSALAIFHNGQWQYYKPIDELIFQNTVEPELYLVYEKNGNTISRMHRNINIGGFSIPMTFDKVPWHSTVYFLNELAALFPFFNLTYLLFPLAWLVVLVKRKNNPQFFENKSFKTATRLTTIAFTLLILISVLMFLQLFQVGNDLIFGVPQSIVFLQVFSYLIPVVLVVLIYRLFKVWNNKEGVLGSRIYLSVFVLSGTVYTLILHQWHFIGLNF